MVSTLYPDPQGQGGPKQGLGCIYSLNRETRQKNLLNKGCREGPF